ncbi:MAG: HD domain-containing protein [Syntrophales bacterium]
MTDQGYRQAIDLARRIAAEVGSPRFYVEKAREVALSRKLFASEPAIAAGLRIVAGRGECLGHGLVHVEKVAIDAGALILAEGGAAAAAVRIRRVVFLAQLAGIFHDICRQEKEHAERGAQEAERLLASFSLLPGECADIVDAIRGHEAFRPRRSAAGRTAQLLSDALYDADKFRWGPDNFTETLWAMVSLRGVPLQALIPRLLPGIEGIRKIRDSFWTPTGREYGPDFIDRGLTIGLRLHAALTAAEA